jgi:lipase
MRPAEPASRARHLSLHAWGEEGGRRVVCLHGVTSWGGHFGELARELPGTRVLAPDLLGHGASPQEPPWAIDEHLAAVDATAGGQSAVWIGHSFGARLAFELAARSPALVERLVLLDPAIWIAPHVALFAAENARRERAYDSFAAAIDARYVESALHAAPRRLLERELHDHLARGPDGRWRYRYCQAAVVAAYGALATEPPGYESVRVPTLLVLGERSYVPYDHLLDAHAAALGDLLQVARVPGGHTVLWDALAETSAAIRSFLA